MSIRPFRFSNSLANDGAVKEFLLSEEDWLAYRAGLYLSNITIDEASSLVAGETGKTQVVGIYDDTTYVGEPSEPARTISRNYKVDVTSTASTHTVEFVTPSDFPPLVFDDDTVVINVEMDASSTGSGFQELQANMTFGVSTNYVVQSVSAFPAATSIVGNVVTWEDFSPPELGGTYIATYTITFSNYGGYFEGTLNVSSTDLDATPIAASDNFTSLIRVEDRRAFGYSTISTGLYQNTNKIGIQETGPDKRNPVYFDRARNGLKEMDDRELEILCEDIIKNIMENERPGSYRLSPGKPSDDWTVYLENIFTDTRSNGSSISYSIWIRTADIEPPEYRTLAIKRKDDYVFEALQEMTVPQIDFTLGERSKKVIMATGIGTYDFF